MSVCGPDEDSGSEEPCGPSGGPLREMRRRKSPSKILRLLTVLAYLLSVSMAAIVLSIYYMYVWKAPPCHTRAGRRDCLPHPINGGSNSTVKLNSTSTTETTAIATTEAITNENVTEATTSSLPTSLPSSISQSPPTILSLETTINNASTTNT